MFTSALLVASALVLAHAAVVVPRAASITDFSTSPVEFTYPPPRSGYNANNATAYPCGGAELGTRTNYPLTGGRIGLDVDTLAANVNLMYANSSNPTTFHQFSTFTDTILDVSDGAWCGAGPNFQTEGLTSGNDVTLLVIYQLYGNKTYMYHCADIKIVEASAYIAPTDLACSNSSAVLKTATDDESLVLKGSNYSAAQEGIDGQTVSIDLAAATAVPSSSASGSESSAVAASSAASSAAASASSTSSAGISSQIGGLGIVSAAIGGCYLLL
ncbi:uncharacterized protein IL334_002250 [Kwoniella shivajii]|uniref:Copper acquisition factor BIM1-like domain-containing protein n=1 Tax=Kwoniella shivajii TaxID=564305 RepID=A0ABZ1CYA7_9TREE|nr:hypothetical protein IL334_002250 [Kwoniella shivajii]